MNQPTATQEHGSEWDLVWSAQAGDSEAFEHLYRKYSSRVMSYLALRTGNHALAEDLTSETFLKAFTNLRSLRYMNRRTPASWLFTIARNLATDSGRKSSHFAEVDLESSLAGEFLSDSVENVEGRVIARLELNEALRYLAHLSPDQRECVKLRIFEQLSTLEIARRMKRNTDAVRALQSRAFRRMSSLRRNYVLESGAIPATAADNSAPDGNQSPAVAGVSECGDVCEFPISTSRPAA